ncbi:MAG: hypothetical protein U0N13_14180 [Parabacteroides johnsonii]|mgnify:FL=1
MKLRNIISVMCVMASVFTACVNEIPTDSPEIAQVGDLSIVFAVGDAQTKAEAADGYEWATPDELEISRVTIAVFDDQNICVGFVKDPNLISETVTVNDKSLPAYRASLSELPINKKLTFVVIANSTNEYNGLGKGSSYSEFEALQEETTGFPYAERLANTLVKIGSMETTLSVSTTEIQVPLRSLSARIDFGGVSSLNDETEEKVLADEDGDWVQLEYNSNNVLMDKLLKSVAGYDDIQDLNSKGWGDGKNHSQITWYQNFYYYRDRKSTTYRISFYKQETKKNRKEIRKQGAYWQGPIGLSGANQLSYLLYIDNQPLYKEAGAANCNDTTFYSYPSSDSRFNLTFTLQCGIGESIISEYDKEVRYAYVVQRNYKGWYFPDTPYPTGKDMVTIPNNEVTEELVNCGSEDVEKVSDQTVNSPTYETCKLTIDGNQLQAGHLYRLTGIYNPPVSEDIIWQVAEWDGNHNVKIDFGSN